MTTNSTISFDELFQRAQRIADRAAACQQAMRSLQQSGADAESVQRIAGDRLSQLFEELHVLSRQSGYDLYALLKREQSNGEFGLIKDDPMTPGE